jgi:hypothetical protein
MPSFLSLPPNLRTTILELALTYDHPLSLSGIYPDSHGEGATTTLTRTHLAPTQLNRQLRREALPLFFTSNTFALCLQPVYVKYIGTRKGKRTEIFRRSYGDAVTASWFATLPEEGLREIKNLRVYVACVTRWDPEGDEMLMEREKWRAYSVGEGTAGTGRMTEHILYDVCSGAQFFYELDLEAGSVEGFVEVYDEDEDDGLELDLGGTECGVCMGVLQRWVDSVDEDEDEDEDGEKVVTREKLVDLAW